MIYFKNLRTNRVVKYGEEYVDSSDWINDHFIDNNWVPRTTLTMHGDIIERTHKKDVAYFKVVVNPWRNEAILVSLSNLEVIKALSKKNV